MRRRLRPARWQHNKIRSEIRSQANQTACAAASRNTHERAVSARGGTNDRSRVTLTLINEHDDNDDDDAV